MIERGGMQRGTSDPGSPRTAYLRIDRLTKRFGAFTALEDISFDIYQGEFICFLGPSGCGKTTLLRAIAGLDIQSAGRIDQGGRDISGLPPSERDFGIVFQSYALFPNLTVFDNVAYGLRSRRTSRADIAKRVTELLALVGMPEAARKYPAQLSGGQQQRVALARAIATSPGLLLLDEPLSALDARVRVRLRHEIKDLQRRLRITTIMVTHDQEEALAMADRIVVMNQGAIEQIGSPMDIYRRPASPFVADFVGSMNLLEAVLVASGQVRFGQVDLACGATDGLAPQSKVRMCVRPEDVSVRNVGPTTPNALPVEIVALEFLGSFCRATLKPEDPGAAEFAADFSINLMRDLALEAGKRLQVAIPPDRILVYAKEG